MFRAGGLQAAPVQSVEAKYAAIRAFGVDRSLEPPDWALVESNPEFARAVEDGPGDGSRVDSLIYAGRVVGSF